MLSIYCFCLRILNLVLRKLKTFLNLYDILFVSRKLQNISAGRNNYSDKYPIHSTKIISNIDIKNKFLK
jgi:hypothetical protein